MSCHVRDYASYLQDPSREHWSLFCRDPRAREGRPRRALSDGRVVLQSSLQPHLTTPLPREIVWDMQWSRRCALSSGEWREDCDDRTVHRMSSTWTASLRFVSESERVVLEPLVKRPQCDTTGTPVSAPQRPPLAARRSVRCTTNTSSILTRLACITIMLIISRRRLSKAHH